MRRNEQLRWQRIARNWRQQDLADQLGVTIVSVQRWERGSQTPGPYYRARLCMLFGLNAQELGLVEGESSASEGNATAQEASADESSLWTVPYARNPHFTGRDTLLHQVGRLFESSTQERSIQQVALAQTQAITGLGGIGKTQLAIEYAYRARMQGRYQHTLWISATNAETILTSFVELARLVRLLMPTFVEQEEMNQRAVVAAVLRWLEQCKRPWLLIFDNVDDLSLIQPYLPHWGNGHILLTTRAHAIGAVATSLAVDTMGVMEATHLLLRRTHRFSTSSPEALEEAIQLVTELAQFPLAIDQAGAYIEETGCAIPTYLQLYQSSRLTLLARRGRQATGYPESVITTWSFSFAEVERINPAAAELLCLCAFLAPDHIPEELLTEGAAYWPEALREAVTDMLSFNHMLETLLAFSLVKRLSEDRMLSLHRLVQVVQMERMEDEIRHSWAQRIVRAMHAIFPADTQDVATWPRCLRYLEQVEACSVLIEQQGIVSLEAGDLLDRAGTYFREHMWYTQAEPLYRRALAIREQSPSPEHPDTATTVLNLAILQRDTGNVVEAESLYRRALAMRERALGPEHPYTANVLSNLANLYLVQRRYREAVPLYKRALAIRGQRLSLEQLDSDEYLHPLANFYVTQGRYEEAESLYQRILATRELHLGPFHYRTTNVLNNLANLYLLQQRYEEAEPLYERVLTVREQQFGSAHPHTATSLYNLAMLQQNKASLVEAERLYRRALAIREQHLGPEHPAFADCLGGLAALYYKQGQIARAKVLALSALHIHEHHLGPSHPSTAEDLHTLAMLYQDEGRHAEAEQLLLRVLAVREHAFDFSPAERWYDLPGRSTPPACPQCRQTTEIIKSGKNRSGSQRFRCSRCRLYFTPQPNARQPDQARKTQALALVKEGMSHRHIARQLGVHHQTVGAWIGPHSKQKSE